MRKWFTVLMVLVFELASCACRSVLTGAQGVTNSSQPFKRVTFPGGWQNPQRPVPMTSIQQLEIRKRPNSPVDEFLFAALPNGDHFYTNEVDKRMPPPEYSNNVFAVNFSPEPRTHVISKTDWESGARIPSKPRTIFFVGRDRTSGEIEYRQKRYAKVGKYWGGGHLSTTGKWLAVFSYNGEPGFDLGLFGGGEVRIGDVFWQIYDTVTGQKIFEYERKNVKKPTYLDHPVVWLEDRYFLFPEDEYAKSLGVVTLPSFTPEPYPLTLQLPSRRDAGGQPLPAGDRHEVWTPLAPLTKEQAAKITAPSDTEITEVRLLAQPEHDAELLFAIKDETENHKADPPRRPAGEYNLRVFNTYYHAISLNDPTKTRVVNKTDWDRGKELRSQRPEVSSERLEDKMKGTVPPYRQFAKTGATWGSPPVLGANEWLAVFSYSEDQEKMFVDLYEQRLGDKLSSTALPITIAPNKLFRNAMWVEGGYLFLPLNTSLDSFAFWRLPD